MFGFLVFQCAIAISAIAIAAPKIGYREWKRRKEEDAAAAEVAEAVGPGEAEVVDDDDEADDVFESSPISSAQNSSTALGTNETLVGKSSRFVSRDLVLLGDLADDELDDQL